MDKLFNQKERSRSVKEGDLLWNPSRKRVSQSNIFRYLEWLKNTEGHEFSGYDELWQWSVGDPDGFWKSIWDFFGVKSHKHYTQVLGTRNMPGAKWFNGAEVNYAEHALKRKDEHIAYIFQSELRATTHMTYKQLYEKVASTAIGLRRLGINKGDRVVAYMPNIPETLIAFLATASIGAIWSACSPEFGTPSVVERFKQIEPVLLFAVDGYRYGGRNYSRLDDVTEIQKHLNTLKGTVIVPYLDDDTKNDLPVEAITWQDLCCEEGQNLEFEPVSFDHPLWVLYSSGTTGMPKPIVQGHGGILLEHYKVLSLHMDLTENDRFFWFTTAGWMMWNLLIGGLLLESTIILFDGDPSYPDMKTLWRYADQTDTTYFGISASYIQACMKSNLQPSKQFELSDLKAVGSTGSPLSPEGFQWIYLNVASDILVGSFSGGTDMCTGFLGPCPLSPVYAGEIQCRCLGAPIEAYNQFGKPVVDQVGELVITGPMPSMPLFFWNDQNDRRYIESYFENYDGVWRHGDWVKVTNRGSCVIYGRSDSTLNRGGVRTGTGEYYRVIEDMDEVVDSMVVDTGRLAMDGRLLLFLKIKEGIELDTILRRGITNRIRTELSPRHVPDEIHSVSEIPRTLNGKKLEIPVKNILAGMSVEEAISLDAMSNPGSLQFFIELHNRMT